ncbi:MAG TPA: porin, partial [Planctomycetota bacterium]|nr:porin [Planctomycetota bacterium]
LAGRGKVPVGLEFLQPDTVTMFIERAYPTQLVPNRDNGAQVAGDIAGGVLNYTIGIYNGAADGASRDTDNTDDKDGVARLYATPFLGGEPALAGLSFGVGGSYGTDAPTLSGTGAVTSSGLSTYKSPGQATIFSYIAPAASTLANSTTADGSHWRVAPQLYYAFGPFSTMAEYTRSVQELRFNNIHDTVANQAWQVSTGWVFTGENAAFKGVNPSSPLAYDGSAWGALEVVARVHRLDIDGTAFSSGFASRTLSVEQATGYAVGLNWYLSRQVKLKLDFEHTEFVGGAGTNLATLHDREDENLISTQVQLVY